MRQAQKPDHVSLNTLINRLREGQYVIPDFQRDFEWEPWDINALIRSIFLDYYIGSLLLWKGKEDTFKALACQDVYAYLEPSRQPRYIVLDGQQRLTAMYYAMMAPDAPAPRRANRFLYFIRVDLFMEEVYDDAFIYEWNRRSVRLLDNPQAQYEQHVFPVSILGKSGWALPNWVQEYEKHWMERARQASEAGDSDAEHQALKYVRYARGFSDHVRGITEEYQVAYIELDQELPLEKICDIFTQINSRGVRLDVFDLINALLRPQGPQLRYMWRDASALFAFVHSDRMNVYVLQVMSILRQAYCSPKYLYFLLPGTERQMRDKEGVLRKEVMVRDVADFKQRWHQAVSALDMGIKLLQHPQEFGVASSQYLPYVSILPAFAALQEEIRQLPADRKFQASRKFRQWYWASVFLNRYSGSVESTIARDYLDMKAWFENDIDAPGLIAEFKERFRNIDLRREIRKGSSVYNGIFNLLVIKGARDWITGNLPVHGELDDHHIIPKSWGRDHEMEGVIDTILNRTPMTSETNRVVIHDQAPNQYLPKMIEANGREVVLKMLESHLISPLAMEILLRDPFTPDDFEEFIQERQRTIQEGIEDLLIKARLDLSPKLRELDARVESIELQLRSLIVQVLEGDEARLPEHVRQKVRERLQLASRRNPSLMYTGQEDLALLLEYADLRELQDTLTGKALWPEFSARFGTREALAGRFAQLAELRNSMRHSRSVSEVVQKDGEAAVLWFGGVLDRYNDVQNVE